ncbi:MULTISPECIES: hypothetical protein [unclassified Sphingobacterium]|uniref:hypothetical protein n=1 Tax=unclassified Sphingobacterium TaxID=2609468 RepID=UPI001AE871C1|nr:MULTISPECIES: hypothetical protein [unclassified Sphingobacterium]MDR6735429.1 hypothetical protein [Sphingobacterium sp. 2149]
MYWYQNNNVHKTSSRALSFFAGSALLFWSCGSPSATKSPQKSSDIFSVDSFFNAEVNRLQQLNPAVLKSVSKDGEKEQRELKIGSWKNELSAFQAADISKNFDPSLYEVSAVDCVTEFTAKKKDLQIQKLRIEFDKNEKVKHIHIDKKITNSLYDSQEKLDYFSDSLYRIVKLQDVQGLDANQYEIVGKFIPPKK